jgi:hypothetical protein
VWKHALALAAALGETTVTEAVWKRAYKDVKGTDPGDSPEAQQLRNAAARPPARRPRGRPRQGRVEDAWGAGESTSAPYSP